MAFSMDVVNGKALTEKNFKDPPKEMGILPFWFWNGAMDEKEMEWQLREYRDRGITGLFIHGRFGLKVPYISDAWFDKVKFAVAKGKELGLSIWVYDEMNWPSGTAERQVIAKHPSLTQKYLELVALNVDGPLFTFLEATDDRYVNTGNSNPIAAFGCTEEEFQNGITHPIDLTPNLSFDKVLPWEAPPGKWRLLYFLEKEVPYYIDALNPESTERFIELTHERYAGAVGKEFGNVVPGFYTDEPAMHYYHVGIDNFVIPWTKGMFRVFRERRGYDLRPFLPALYLNMGEKTARVRWDFWRTLSEQYTESYYKRIRRWCEEHGVLFTGHLLFEEWIRMHARCEGNLFRHLEQMHLIGVDHLYPKIGTAKEPDQHVALKIASSAAHHFGSTRLLCESMGGAYWDCTLQRMKWIANWEYVLGVNLFNNHGYHYSIEGERKRDWPPSQFYHHTWWKHYDRFTTYMSRMSHLLSGGDHVAKVLVLYPLNSIWANYVPQSRDAVGNVIESEYCYLTDTLLRLHYDFDFVDEEVLAKAETGAGRIGIRGESYSVVILPPLTHITKAAFETLRRFVRGGGRVIADTLLPVAFLDSPADGASGAMEKLFGVNPDKILVEFRKGGDRPLRTVRGKTGGRTFFFRGKGLAASSGMEELRRVLSLCAAPDVTVSDENVFYLHRVKDGKDIYLFVNTAGAPSRGVEISFEKKGKPYLWDLNTGGISPLHVYAEKKGRLTLALDFPPVEAHVVVLGPPDGSPRIESTNAVVESFDGKTISAYAPGALRTLSAAVVRGKKRVSLKGNVPKPLPPLSLGKKFRFAAESSNALLLSRWKMCSDHPAGPDSPSSPAYDDSSWLDVKNGAWEMQLPQERDLAAYPVTLWYRTSFEAEYIPPDLRVVIDGFSGVSHRIFLNGAEITSPGKRSSLDAEMREIDIASRAVQGRNTVAVSLVVNRRTDGILDLLKIMGEFALRPSGESFVIVKPVGMITTGDWTGQGFPFYSGTGIYSSTLVVPEKYAGGALFLNVECGEDVCEVSVNGSPLLIAPWAPTRFDVSGLVKPGTNTVEIRVTNTLINILEGVRKASGISVPPVLEHHHRCLLSRAQTKG